VLAAPADASRRYRITAVASILVRSSRQSRFSRREGAPETDTSASPVARPPPASGLRLDAALARIELPAWAAGALVAVGLFSAFVLLMVWSGGAERALSRDTGIWEYRDFRLSVLVTLLAGYLPVARHQQVRSAARNRAALEPSLVDDAPDPAAFCALDAGRATRAACMGILIVPLSALVIDQDLGTYFEEGYWRAEAIFTWCVGTWSGYWLGSFLYVTLAYARRFSRLAAWLGPIDLLDFEAVRPFARHGLASALLWLVLLSVASVNAVDVAWFGVTAGIAVAGGVAALVLPVQGVHARLCAAKQAERARIDAAIRGDEGALEGSLLAARVGTLSLSDLLAYRRFVEAVREWPFDTFTFVRFGLYLAIPLGSWLGGAFVERLLGAALD
jgi:hypothetical protein